MCVKFAQNTIKYEIFCANVTNINLWFHRALIINVFRTRMNTKSAFWDMCLRRNIRPGKNICKSRKTINNSWHDRRRTNIGQQNDKEMKQVLTLIHNSYFLRCVLDLRHETKQTYYPNQQTDIFGKCPQVDLLLSTWF